MRLNENELDALTEAINIGVGRAANALSEITGSPIQLVVPKIHVCGTPEFHELVTTVELHSDTTVHQGFDGDLSGRALLAFSKDNAFELARIVGGIQTNHTEMDEELSGVLEEIGNIVLNAVLGSIANIFDCRLSYTLPTYLSKSDFSAAILKCIENAESSDSLAVIADTALTIASRDLSGSLLVLFETGDIETLLSALTRRVMV